MLLPKKKIRKLISFVWGEYYYTKFIIFTKKKGIIIIKNTLYGAYNKSEILLPGKYYKRK